jgi:hypothetical protein
MPILTQHQSELRIRTKKATIVVHGIKSITVNGKTRKLPLPRQ